MTRKKSRLDVPINILITVPVKRALQRLADDNMISVSDIVRAAINAAVPVQFEKYTAYLAEATEEWQNTPEVLGKEK